MSYVRQKQLLPSSGGRLRYRLYDLWRIHLWTTCLFLARSLAKVISSKTAFVQSLSNLISISVLPQLVCVDATKTANRRDANVRNFFTSPCYTRQFDQAVMVLTELHCFGYAPCLRIDINDRPLAEAFEALLAGHHLSNCPSTSICLPRTSIRFYGSWLMPIIRNVRASACKSGLRRWQPVIGTSEKVEKLQRKQKTIV